MKERTWWVVVKWTQKWRLFESANMKRKNKAGKLSKNSWTNLKIFCSMSFLRQRWYVAAQLVVKL